MQNGFLFIYKTFQVGCFQGEAGIFVFHYSSTSSAVQKKGAQTKTKKKRIPNVENRVWEGLLRDLGNSSKRNHHFSSSYEQASPLSHRPRIQWPKIRVVRREKNNCYNGSELKPCTKMERYKLRDDYSL